MSSIAYEGAPRAVDVLPARVTRRLTRRDGLLPLVFTAELLTGMAFGVAGHSAPASSTSVPARLTMAPVAQVTVVPSPSTVPSLGPAVGPLLPGTVRPSAAPAVVTVTPPAPRRHAPRNPFGALVRSAA